jgi:hypothetical protein
MTILEANGPPHEKIPQMILGYGKARIGAYLGMAKTENDVFWGNAGL